VQQAMRCLISRAGGLCGQSAAETVVGQPAQERGKMDKLSASEALYGFVGWLTTRNEPITMSASDDAGKAADLVSEFCKVNTLAEPREGWEHNLFHPQEAAQLPLQADGAEQPRKTYTWVRDGEVETKVRPF
jgi:hypothetical protein